MATKNTPMTPRIEATQPRCRPRPVRQSDEHARRAGRTAAAPGAPKSQVAPGASRPPKARPGPTRPGPSRRWRHRRARDHRPGRNQQPDAQPDLDPHGGRRRLDRVIGPDGGPTVDEVLDPRPATSRRPVG